MQQLLGSDLPQINSASHSALTTNMVAKNNLSTPPTDLTAREKAIENGLSVPE